MEAIQTSQKIARNVWDEGSLPKGTWHSNDESSEFNNYPTYAHWNPAIPSACDAIINEIAGIPLIIKTGYQIMTDSKEREKFSAIFSKEGISSLAKGMLTEAKTLVTDGQQTIYTGSNLATTVTFAVVTGGGNVLLKGSSKLIESFDILDGLAQKFQNCPKLTKYINKLQKDGSKVSAELDEIGSTANKIGSEQVEAVASQADNIKNAVNNLYSLSQEFDATDLEKAINFIPAKKIEGIVQKLAKFKDCEGIKKIIQDLGTGKTKSIGASFVLEYADNFEASAVKFEVTELIEATTEEGEKILTRRYDAIINGTKHEMKYWREWQGWSDAVINKQFITDLGNQSLENLEDLQWVFKQTSGITKDVLKDKGLGHWKVPRVRKL